jgi:hypothetical protein
MLRSLFAAAGLVLASWSGAWAQQDIKGGHDHPFHSRMPGFYMSDYSVKDFDAFDCSYVTGKEAHWEGKLTKLSYTRKEGA